MRKNASKRDKNKLILFPQVVAQQCSVKKMFLEISQNSKGNTCARASFLIKLQASNTFTYIAHAVAASSMGKYEFQKTVTCM